MGSVNFFIFFNFLHVPLNLNFAIVFDYLSYFNCYSPRCYYFILIINYAQFFSIC